MDSKSSEWGAYKSRLCVPGLRRVADFLIYKLLWPLSSGGLYLIQKDQVNSLWYRPAEDPE